jgi:hypothetical protein
MVKKVAAAVAVKQVWDKVQESRHPKRSFLSRIGPVGILAAIGGGLFYLWKSGKLPGGSTESTYDQYGSVSGGNGTGSPEGALSGRSL